MHVCAWGKFPLSVVFATPTRINVSLCCVRSYAGPVCSLAGRISGVNNSASCLIWQVSGYGCVGIYVLRYNEYPYDRLEYDKTEFWNICHYSDVIFGSIASQITSLTIVYSTVYSDADQRKHKSSASLAFVRGIHRGPVNSPHIWPVTREFTGEFPAQMASNAENVSIWWRHHDDWINITHYRSHVVNNKVFRWHLATFQCTLAWLSAIRPVTWYPVFSVFPRGTAL